MVFTVKAAELKLLSRAILYFHQSCRLPLQYLVHYHFYHRNFLSEQSNQRFSNNKDSTYRIFPQSYHDSLVLTHMCEHCSYKIRYGLKTWRSIDLWYITYIVTRWGWLSTTYCKIHASWGDTFMLVSVEVRIKKCRDTWKTIEEGNF